MYIYTVRQKQQLQHPIRIDYGAPMVSGGGGGSREREIIIVIVYIRELRLGPPIFGWDRARGTPPPCVFPPRSFKFLLRRKEEKKKRRKEKERSARVAGGVSSPLLFVSRTRGASVPSSHKSLRIILEARS